MRLVSLLFAIFWAAICMSSSLAAMLQQAVDIQERGGAQKIVIAHFMVGNTYPYKQEDWKRAITLAASKGIDAFALNTGTDSWQPARVSDAYRAALGTNFKLFMSFDMASLPCANLEDGNLIRHFIHEYGGHPNQLIYDGKIFVSSFGGQFCRFGASHMDEGWYKILKSSVPPVHFVPAFFVEPPIFPSLKAIDGAFSWNSAWPMGDHDTDWTYDNEYLIYLPDRTYMAGVSPWFFTHYSKETYNKNFLYRTDSWHFVERWENVVKYRNSIDFVQVISWNDYGESHYIGPIDGAQPNSQAWTNGFDHQGWLDLMHHYIIAFKTGAHPQINVDRVFLWGRLYPANAETPDPIGKPNNYNFVGDYVWAVIFLTAPGHLDLACGPSQTSVNLPGGVNKAKIPLLDECNVVAKVSRNGKTTINFSPPASPA